MTVRPTYITLLFLLTQFFAVTALSEERPYRIGAIIPQTGPIASMTKYVFRGVQLGISSLDPGSRGKIEVVFEDDQFDPRKTIAAYQKLSVSSPLDAVLVVGSAPALALAPITEKEGKLLIAIGASDPKVVENRTRTFTHWVIPKTLGNRLAQELLSRNFQRMAFLTTATAGAMADIDATIEALWAKKADDKIIFSERFLQEQLDFRTTIAKLKSKNPDVTVLALGPGSLSSFAQQARDLHLQGEIAGVESFEDESEVRAANGALNNTWYVNASDPTADFIASYRKTYQEHPGWAAANGFDAITLLSAAVSVNANNEAIRTYLNTVKDYHGSAGVYSASGDGRFTLPAAIKRITDQGFVSGSLAEISNR